MAWYHATRLNKNSFIPAFEKQVIQVNELDNTFEPCGHDTLLKS